MNARDIAPCDSRVFGKDWWALPLGARHASVGALRVGLAVSVEMVKHRDYYKPYPCVVWRGTAEQFLKTSAFADGIAVKRACGRYVTPGHLRGSVYPDGEGRFRFVIKGCNYRRRHVIRLLAKKALADESYQNFRHAFMAGYPVTREGLA
jgi:hypothetical protein